MRFPIKTILFTALSCIILLSSCNSPTTTQKARIFGTISLANIEDYSGIHVEIHPIMIPNSNINSIAESSSQITMSLKQIHVFDYRLSSPLVSVLTNQAGDFTCEIDFGTYNIVVYKEGYGLISVLEVTLASSEYDVNTLNPNQDFILYPDVHYSATYINGSFTFSSLSQTVIDSDTFFHADTSIIIEPGAVVRIEPNATLNIYGALRLPSNADTPVIFQSNGDYYNSGVKAEVEPFQCVRLHPTVSLFDNLLKNIIVRQSKQGLVINGVNYNLSGSYFECRESCVNVSNVTSSNIENCVFVTSEYSTYHAVMISSATAPTIENCIFFNNPFCLRFSVIENGLVSNNYFKATQNAILMDFDVTASLSHNTIDSHVQGLLAHAYIEFSLLYNSITAGVGFDVDGAYSTGTVNFNNFNCSSFAIKYLSQYGGDLDARNNYWNTSSSDSIAQLVYDKSDLPSNYPSYSRYGFVNYIPYRTAAISGAGLQ